MHHHPPELCILLATYVQLIKLKTVLKQASRQLHSGFLTPLKPFGHGTNSTNKDKTNDRHFPSPCFEYALSRQSASLFEIRTSLPSDLRLSLGPIVLVMW